MSDYLEVLESFPGSKEGHDAAWASAERHAKTLVDKKKTDRFAIGVRQIRDDASRGMLWAVVLVRRKD